MGGWEEVGDALVRAMAAGTGLDDEHVVWGWQDADEPTLPYLDLAIPDVRTLGLDYLKKTTDLSRPRGQEIKSEVRGQREVTLLVQGFTQSARAIGDDSAIALVDKAVTALTLNSIRAFLNRVDVGVFDTGTVQNVPQLVKGAWRGRAICNLRFYMPAQLIAEYYGYIERVSGSVTIKDGASGDQTTDFSEP